MKLLQKFVVICALFIVSALCANISLAGVKITDPIGQVSIDPDTREKTWIELNPIQQVYIANKILVVPYYYHTQRQWKFSIYFQRGNTVTQVVDNQGSFNLIEQPRPRVEKRGNNYQVFFMAGDEGSVQIPLGTFTQRDLERICINGTHCEERSITVDISPSVAIEYSYPLLYCSQYPKYYGPFDVVLGYNEKKCTPVNEGTVTYQGIAYPFKSM